MDDLISCQTKLSSGNREFLKQLMMHVARAAKRGRNSRVFGEKICDKFITKFGEEFSESPISSPNLVKNPVRSPNLVTNSVTYFVRNVVAHLYLHQI